MRRWRRPPGPNDDVAEPWQWCGEPLTEPPEGHEGFVYCIHDTHADMLYVGKKSFWSMQTPEGGGRRVRVGSDWRRYFGSNRTLMNLVAGSGPLGFDRYVLSLHPTAGGMNLEELRQIMIRNALNDPSYYNNALGKFKGNVRAGSVHADRHTLPHRVRSPVMTTEPGL